MVGVLEIKICNTINNRLKSKKLYQFKIGKVFCLNLKTKKDDYFRNRRQLARE